MSISVLLLNRPSAKQESERVDCMASTSTS